MRKTLFSLATGMVLLLLVVTGCTSTPAGTIAPVQLQTARTPTPTRTSTPTMEVEDETTTVDEDETAAAGEDETAAAGEDETAAAGEDETAAAGEDETAAVGEDETATADEDETAAADEDETATADEDETTTADEDETAAVDEDETTTVDEDETATVDEDETMTADENETTTADEDENLDVTLVLTDTEDMEGMDTDEAALDATDAVTDTEDMDTDEADLDATDAVTDTANITSTVALTHGPISGEVTDSAVVLWVRGEMTGTIALEIAETDAFTAAMRVGIDVTAADDFTGKQIVDGLKPNQAYVYRVLSPAGNEDGEAEAETVAPVGMFTTAPTTDTAAPLSFIFGACVGGGGQYCRPENGGWTIFDAMSNEEPDFFVLTGDSVYVDSACTGEGIVPGAEGPYRDLEGFRTRYRYHLEDASYASFLAETPVYVTWDDHEIVDNFSKAAIDKLYPQLFTDGITAYFNYWPLLGVPEEPTRIYRSVSRGAHADMFMLDTRTYREPIVNWDPNPATNEAKTMLGKEQLTWLKEGLQASNATWKFIVTSVPLSYGTGYPQPAVDGYDGWANVGSRMGYEQEVMSLLFFVETHNITNVVFLTGDTHWPFAISYDPDRDNTANFLEFGSSPMSSLPLNPTKPDTTFNPTVLYEGKAMDDQLFNYGHITVDEDGNLTFRVLDAQGTEQYNETFQPE